MMLSAPNSTKSAKLVGVSAKEAKTTNMVIHMEFTTIMPNGVLKTSVNGINMEKKSAADVTWKYVRNCDGKEYSGTIHGMNMEKNSAETEDMYTGAVILEFSKECVIILNSRGGIHIWDDIILLHETEDSDLKFMQKCKSEMADMHAAEIQSLIAERDSLKRELVLLKESSAIVTESGSLPRPLKINRIR